MAYLKKRGRYWHAVIPGGRRDREKTYSLGLRADEVTKTEARRALVELERRHRQGHGLAHLPQLTWAGAVQQYLDAHTGERTNRPKSYQTRCTKTKAWRAFVPGDDPVPADAQAVRALVLEYLARRRAERDATTVAADRRYLHMFFAWLMASPRSRNAAALVGWSANPAAVPGPRPVRRTPITLNKDEDRLLRARVKGTVCWPVYGLMRYFGVRLEEALLVTWERVHFEDRTILAKDTKTDRDRRVPMGRDGERFLKGLDRRGAFVAPSPRGKRWNESNAIRKWREITVGLPEKLRARYMLRRTCISRALARGMPLAVASDVFGDTVATLDRFYRETVGLRSARQWL